MGRHRGKHHFSLAERFEKLFIPEPNSGCWLWIGTIHGRYNCKYGAIKDEYPSNKAIQAHRASWMLHNGHIREGDNILHKCDNTLCVNPRHLFQGSQRDNMTDCWTKNRHIHKLTKDEAVQIKKDTRKYAEIGESFHVCPMTVCHIKKGKTWKHV